MTEDKIQNRITGKNISLKPAYVLFIYIFLFFVLILLGRSAMAQMAPEEEFPVDLFQTIRERVIDSESGTGIPGANIILLNSDPLQGILPIVNYRLRF